MTLHLSSEQFVVQAIHVVISISVMLLSECSGIVGTAFVFTRSAFRFVRGPRCSSLDTFGTLERHGITRSALDCDPIRLHGALTLGLHQFRARGDPIRLATSNESFGRVF